MRSLGLSIGVLLTFVFPLGASDEVTRQQVDDILTELHKIRTLLERDGKGLYREAQPKRITVDIKSAPVLGARDAEVSIVEFMDYQCPYCKQFQAQTFQSLKRAYIDTGKVRFYVVDFPLDIHPQALVAAESAHCATEQGKFWPMHDRMQLENAILGNDKIVELGRESGLDVSSLRRCVESAKYKEEIQKAVRDATGYGVHATPTFVVGKTIENRVEGEVILGAVPLGVLQRKIESFTNN